MDGVEAFVLAGGRSSRMGRDKALLSLGGATVLGRVVAVARAVTGRVRLVANDAPTYAGYGLEVLPDRWPEGAALVGIGTALTHLEAPHALVLACDMPLLTPAFLGHLVALAATADVVVPETTAGGPQPLCAIYSRACLAPLERAVEAGRFKVLAFLAEVRVRTVDEAEMRRLGHDPAQLANLNTPEDYARAVARLAISGKG